MHILVLNVGSATLKFKLLRMPEESGLAQGNEPLGEEAPRDALARVLDRCRPEGIDMIGHRVVHGGPQWVAPTRIEGDVLAALRTLAPLAPLHNPIEVALIEAAQSLLPEAAAVVCFDTAFHRTLPEVAWRYALPRALSDRLGLRRYGFHGLSHRYVSERLLECLGRSADGTRLIVCHLGSGASVCALRDGRSVDTSMGFTPLEGLAMGTRSGDLDPGALLYLLQAEGLTAETLTEMLYHQSGLLGLSGRSADVRELESAAHRDPAAELALDVFAYRVRKYIGAYAAALGGVDALAFTGGIGERSATMRARICRDLAFLGLRLDPERNGSASGEREARLSADDAPVSIWTIPTDEERQIAREVQSLLAGARASTRESRR